MKRALQLQPANAQFAERCAQVPATAPDFNNQLSVSAHFDQARRFVCGQRVVRHAARMN